jgi:hypothetical protein
MDYESLSLTELKQLAKNHVPKIKQYYIKSKAELITILNMKEFPLEMKVAKMSMEQLRAEAKKRGHTNFWKMRREQIVKLLYPNPQENYEDDNHTEEHDDPEESERE